ncbi:hypothetical protein HY78_00970 [Rhizorhabdus wittichii DC-6]|nr:hypothetical protein HY78_00970 [Rhizorhabdus wittichii DC-6]
MTAIADTQKRRGRPSTGRTPVMVKLLPEQLERLDQWSEGQSDIPSRPEAIRRLIDIGLKTSQPESR